MRSQATTVPQYLSELPAERRQIVSAVRDLIAANLDSGFAEGIQYGMISWFVPHSLYPPGYHCDPRQPLPFASLAAQKNYFSLHLMCLYGDASNPLLQWFQETWKKKGKSLDMGKACLRFNSLDELALDVLEELFQRVSAKKFIEQYESVVKRGGKTAMQSAAAATPVKKPPTRKAAKSARRSILKRSR